MSNYISTINARFVSLFSSVVTTGSIAAPVAMANEPTGNGIFSMAQGSGSPVALNSAAVAFFGGNSADGTFTARLTGWRRIGDLWIPVPLLALAGTLGAMTGVAGQSVSVSQLFADTLTVSTAFTNAYEIINPASDQVALVKVDLFGCEKLQVQVAKGTCDNVGALAAGF